MNSRKINRAGQTKRLACDCGCGNKTAPRSPVPVIPAAGRCGKLKPQRGAPCGTAARERRGARVNDALDAAGGLTENADERQINRAALVADGEKVYVPELGESGVLSGDDGAADVGSSDESTDAININTADAQLLDELPGVGPATAQAIIKDREENGPFSAPEDIMRVSGIGETKFEKMKDALCV